MSRVMTLLLVSLLMFAGCIDPMDPLGKNAEEDDAETVTEPEPEPEPEPENRSPNQNQNRSPNLNLSRSLSQRFRVMDC